MAKFRNLVMLAAIVVTALVANGLVENTESAHSTAQPRASTASTLTPGQQKLVEQVVAVATTPHWQPVANMPVHGRSARVGTNRAAQAQPPLGTDLQSIGFPWPVHDYSWTFTLRQTNIVRLWMYQNKNFATGTYGAGAAAMCGFITMVGSGVGGLVCAVALAAQWGNFTDAIDHLNGRNCFRMTEHIIYPVFPAFWGAWFTFMAGRCDS